MGGIIRVRVHGGGHDGRGDVFDGADFRTLPSRLDMADGVGPLKRVAMHACTPSSARSRRAAGRLSTRRCSSLGARASTPTGASTRPPCGWRRRELRERAAPERLGDRPRGERRREIQPLVHEETRRGARRARGERSLAPRGLCHRPGLVSRCEPVKAKFKDRASVQTHGAFTGRRTHPGHKVIEKLTPREELLPRGG